MEFKNITSLKFILIAALTWFNTTFADFLPEKPLVVLITSYNNADWYERNLNSVFTQQYSNYRIVYVDDLSNDNNADLVEALVKKAGQEHRFTMIRNQERRLALANIYYAVHDCEDNEIIVSLDGDDWFYDSQVLNKINKIYSTENVWLTHGSIVEYPTGHTGWSMPIPKNVIKENSYRQFRCPSHLRTFYAWLFKKIEIDDLLYDGKFFEMTWDMAMMYPMIEMAAERHAFIKDTLYVYNVRTPLSDNKVNPQLQRFYDMYIRSMPPYERLDQSCAPQQ